MKTFGRIFAAYVLILTLALSAFAGDMSTPLAPQPAPTPAEAQGEISTGLNGDMHTGAPGEMHTTEEAGEGALAGALVGLVQTVLSLL